MCVCGCWLVGIFPLVFFFFLGGGGRREREREAADRSISQLKCWL
jgi:hypothetical protein